MDAPYNSAIYPIYSFHNLVRDALLEVRHNSQAPDALIAASFLTAMSISCQSDIDIELPTGQIRPVSLFVATIADSGERKSSVDSLVCEPIYAYDEEHAEAYAKALTAYQGELRYWKTINASLQRKITKAQDNGQSTEHLRAELIEHAAQKPTEPIRNRLIHQSITRRPLMNTLRGDSKSIAILSDEGELVLKGGAMDELGTINKAWDGARRMTLGRSDDSIEVANPRMTLSFMVQELVFKDFLAKRGQIVRATGHLARYLVGWPESTQGSRFMSLQEPVWEHLPKFHHQVRKLLADASVRRKAGDYSRRLLVFSPEAREYWVQVQNQIEPQLQPGGQFASVRDFASKVLEITSRVAAIFHHFTSQEGGTISRDTLQRAIDVVNWHLLEFIRLFGEPNQEPQDLRDVRLLGTYLYSHYWRYCHTSALRNDVRKCGPIRHQGRFEAALQRLCWAGQVAIRYEYQGRRKGRQWIDLNPQFFSRITG